MNKKLSKIIILIIAVLLTCQSVRAGAVYDFDGDGKTDPILVRGEGNKLMWYALRSRDGFFATQWGINVIGTEDVPVPEDYDGDGKWDMAVWRRPIDQDGQCVFYILYSGTNTYQAIPWGGRINGILDQVIPQDYDGDGKADLAVTRFTSQGNIWYILQSRDGSRVEQFGAGSPVRGDYDGDGKADLAIISRGPGRGDYKWFIQKSSDLSWTVTAFGYAQADLITPGDYDGDGKTDIAVWRGASEFGNGRWYWQRSSDGGLGQIKWGTTFTPDYPVQGDYDGDGKTDVAVWRQVSAGQQSYFYINGSLNGFMAIRWGLLGDSPPRFF